MLADFTEEESASLVANLKMVNGDSTEKASLATRFSNYSVSFCDEVNTYLDDWIRAKAA